jgi:hypothetical protein
MIHRLNQDQSIAFAKEGNKALTSVQETSRRMELQQWCSPGH